jgi:hypothetical protein
MSRNVTEGLGLTEGPCEEDNETLEFQKRKVYIVFTYFGVYGPKMDIPPVKLISSYLANFGLHISSCETLRPAVTSKYPYAR